MTLKARSSGVPIPTTLLLLRSGELTAKFPAEERHTDVSTCLYSGFARVKDI
jgi:hypothetical protein